MLSFSRISFFSIAIFLVSSLVNAAPIDGITKRAEGVVGLDFEVHVLQNDTIVKRGQTDSSALSFEQYYYITYLELGSNKQRIGVDVDTGSSDLWVPTSSASLEVQKWGNYNPTGSSSYKDLGIPFSIRYVDKSGSSGEFVSDTVSLDNGVAKLSNFQFGKVDSTTVKQCGVFGIGPTSLEAGVFQQSGAPEYPNFPIALKNAGYINKAAYSIYLDTPQANSGSVLFGGKDLSKIDGDLVALPHTGDQRRLGATLNSINFGGQNIDVSAPHTFDTGSTLSAFPSDTFSSLVSAVGANTFFNINGYPVVDCGTSGSVAFNFDGISIDIPISEFIMNTGFLCILRIRSAAPGDEILGDDFLRHAYLVYDVENPSVSLAKVKYDDSKSNIVTL
ncbi:candidapepsin-8 [[Candida] railenensis]|uniref:candidapepsin n=1 Tax=[Candida] railenensis TaxID=45579 RepID=A0A9P0QVP3_9ASCO|nr:candidapepsin-8 [[Candida] railenensis]